MKCSENFYQCMYKSYSFNGETVHYASHTHEQYWPLKFRQSNINFIIHILTIIILYVGHAA